MIEELLEGQSLFTLDKGHPSKSSRLHENQPLEHHLRPAFLVTKTSRPYLSPPPSNFHPDLSDYLPNPIYVFPLCSPGKTFNPAPGKASTHASPPNS